MLNVYSRARDGETLLSRSFRAKEFACKDGTDLCLWTANWCRCCRPSVTILAHQWSLPAATAPLHTTGLWAGRFTASISMAVPRISGCPACRWSSLPPTPRPAARHRRHRPLPAKACPCGCAQSKKPVGRVKAVNGMETILSAVIAGAVTLIGVLIANSRSQAVTDTKLEELTREVREHNNFARRVPI